jgi:hypothetical protein
MSEAVRPGLGVARFMTPRGTTVLTIGKRGLANGQSEALG